ncbi:winged helix-turn-helix domain-containing protein [uncultured Endozoicomonas sp.]|uniref:winged helix-turn-helix domain-containing protein n=1 Tax=uncultured Endozoicomonas sp. TaxID=432652 RepID=UPI002623CF81|nr:winged helix-turn-helix domain-containing protein [uncultured Endozoicomonas sp.]
MSESIFWSVKASLYEIGITYSDIAEEVGVAPRTVTYAVKKWEGVCGNPKGKTRQVLKAIERHIGRSVYQER